MAPGKFKVLTYNGIHYNGFQYDMENSAVYALDGGDPFQSDPAQPVVGSPNGTCIEGGFYICTREQVPYWLDLFSNMFYVCGVSAIRYGDVTEEDENAESYGTKQKVKGFTMDGTQKQELITFLPTLLTDSSSGDEWMTDVLNKNQAALKFIDSTYLRNTTSSSKFVSEQVFLDFPESWQNVRYLSLIGTDLPYQVLGYVSALSGYLGENSNPTQTEFKNNFYDLLIPYNNKGSYPYKPYVEEDGENTLYDIYLARESPLFESQPAIHLKGLAIPQRPVTAPPRPSFTNIMTPPAASLGIDANTVIASYINSANGNSIIISYSRTATNKFYYFSYDGATNVFSSAGVPTITGDSITLTSVSGLQYYGESAGILSFILIGQGSSSCEIYRLDFNTATNELAVIRLTNAGNVNELNPLLTVNNITKFLCYPVDSQTVRILADGNVTGETGKKFLDMTIAYSPSIPPDYLSPTKFITFSFINFPSGQTEIQDLKYNNSTAESTVIALFGMTGYTYNLTTPGFTSIDFTINQFYNTVSYNTHTSNWVFGGKGFNNEIIYSGDLTSISGVATNFLLQRIGQFTFVGSFSSAYYTYFIGSDSTPSGNKLTLYRLDIANSIVYPVVYNGGQTPFICQASGKKSAFASYSNGLILRNTEGASDSLYALYDTTINALPGIDGGIPSVPV